MTQLKTRADSKDYKDYGSGKGQQYFTVQEAVEAIGFGKLQIKLSITLGVAWMADSMEIMVLSILGPILMCEWNLVPSQEALITTIVFVGLICGCLVHGKMADIFGRKTVMILTATWSLYFGVLSGVAPTLGWLLLLRSLSGFGIAGMFVCPVYLSEFLPIRYRARAMVIQIACWSLGSIMVTVLALVLMDVIGWRLWMMVCALPLLVFLLIGIGIPESPRYLLAVGKTSKAKEVLNFIAKQNGRQMPEWQLVNDREVAKTGQFRDIFIKGKWKHTVLLSCLFFLLQVCLYGTVLLTTQLVNMDRSCLKEGLVEEAAAVDTCPLECKSLGTQQYIDILWTTTAEIPSIVYSLIFLDLIGRRWVFRLNFTVLCICYAFLFLCVSRELLVAVLFIARMAISSSAQTMYVYTTEVYNTEIRSLALGTISTVGRFGAAITPYIAVVIVKHSMYAGLGTYLAAGLLALVCSFLLPYETKGKALDEV